MELTLRERMHARRKNRRAMGLVVPIKPRLIVIRTASIIEALESRRPIISPIDYWAFQMITATAAIPEICMFVSEPTGL